MKTAGRSPHALVWVCVVALGACADSVLTTTAAPSDAGRGSEIGELADLASLTDLARFDSSGAEPSDLGAADVRLRTDLGTAPDAVVRPDSQTTDSNPDEPLHAWVEILSPSPGARVHNPVEVRFTTGPAIGWVVIESEGWPLHAHPLEAAAGALDTAISGFDYERTLTVLGYGDDPDTILAQAQVRFTVLAPEPEPPSLFFPLSAEPDLFLSAFDDPGAGASFGASRSDGARAHAGCDLYWMTRAQSGYDCAYLALNQDRPVHAVADGVIVAYDSFYQGTWELVVEHAAFTVRYGEVAPNALPGGLGIGSEVTAGQHIANMGTLSTPPRCSKAMLHFELYSGELDGPLTERNNRSYMHVPHANYERRGDLMDCGPFLRALLE